MRVPDTAAEKRLDPADKTLDRESVETILNPVDEYAVEEALRLKEQHGGEVVVLCMGPASALAPVRKALSMGPAAARGVKGSNEPRYPSFKGSMAAKSKPVTDYTLADLGIDPGEVGAAGATTAVVDFAPRPPRPA